MSLRILIVTILLCAFMPPTIADTSLYSSAEKRKLGFEIAQELRCPSSENRSLFDSQTQIANELKGHIFKKLDEGQSKQQIIDFMVARFGERIRYNPSINSGTFALWIVPFVLIILSIIGGVLWVIRQQKTQPADDLSVTDEKTYE